MALTNMLNNKVTSLIGGILFLCAINSISEAQLIQDLSKQAEIPDIINISSSETHLYVLSASEGLVVFRTYSDSLQWLYSSTGMQERGHVLESDIRFAYLFGNNRRLTVIEPTSVLGVYSSTILPSKPVAVERIGFRLFTAMNDGNLGYLDLETAESVDSDITLMDINRVIDLASDKRTILYALNSESEINIFEVRDEEISLYSAIQTDRRIDRIFLTDGELIGTDNDGFLYLIDSDGATRRITRVSGPVDRLSIWKEMVIVRTSSGEIWTGSMDGSFELWKSEERAGNFFTISDAELWLAEFNTLSPVMIRILDEKVEQPGSLSNEVKLKPFNDIVLPFPRALILPIEFLNNIDMSQVSLSYDAPFNNARIRGNTLYWQPLASQTGRHRVTITANSADGQSDSQAFTVDLRSFNAPPQFTPSRPVSIPVGENFDFQITAVDPDGIDRDLIRYLGVDMPDGAVLDEKTGVFSWAPTVRQVGEHRFQVIATDQYGAASSQNYTIRVIEITEEDTDINID